MSSVLLDRSAPPSSGISLVCQTLTAAVGGGGGGGGAGVSSLNDASGIVTIASSNGSVTVTNTAGVNGSIDLVVAPAATGVSSVAGASGAVTVTSTDSSITVTSPGGVNGAINLANPGVRSLSFLNGDVPVALGDTQNVGISAAPGLSFAVDGTRGVSLTAAGAVLFKGKAAWGSGVSFVSVAAPTGLTADGIVMCSWSATSAITTPISPMVYRYVPSPGPGTPDNMQFLCTVPPTAPDLFVSYAVLSLA